MMINAGPRRGLRLRQDPGLPGLVATRGPGGLSAPEFPRKLRPPVVAVAYRG